MADLLPRMESEAPPDYVAFVDHHLPGLRTASAHLAGDPRHGHEIYPEALSAVAARWRLFQLLRTWFGRPRAAEAYLHRVLESRARRWRDEQVYSIEVTVLRPGRDFAPYPRFPFTAPPPTPPPAPPPMSLGLRQAAFLAPRRLPPSAIAEASIAWLHAYAAWQRRRRVAVAITLVLFLAALSSLVELFPAS